jgi:hypothetical protein
MRIRGIAIWVVLSLASIACSSRRPCGCPPRGAVPRGGPPPSVAFDREVETKAVYVAVLREMYVRNWVNEEVEQFVIDPDVSAYPGGRDSDARERMSAARPDTHADFERRRPAARVSPDLDPGRPVRWFKSADFATLPKKGGLSDLGWTAFHEKFPRSGGHITLSRVGFSSDGTEALVHAGRWFDGLGGSSQIVRLQKVGGTWQVKNRTTTVVS